MITWMIIWYISGVISFIYWWTKTENLTLGDMLLSLSAGLIGPVAFLIGMAIHAKESGKEIVLIKKRKK